MVVDRLTLLTEKAREAVRKKGKDLQDTDFEDDDAPAAPKKPVRKK